MAKATDQLGVTNCKTWRLIHIGFFLQLTMQEDFFDVQLVKWPMLNGGHSKKETNKSKFGHRGKGVPVVKTKNLSASFGHQVSFIVISTAI